MSPGCPGAGEGCICIYKYTLFIDMFIYLYKYIFIYGFICLYLYLKSFFCPKAWLAGAAGSAPCILSAPLCVRHLGSTGAAEPPWVQPGRGDGEKQLLLPRAFSAGTSQPQQPQQPQQPSALQGANCPARGHATGPFMVASCLPARRYSCSASPALTEGRLL